MGKHYYRNRRRNGRVVRTYVGALSDPVVALLYRNNRVYQAEVKARVQRRRKEKARSSELEQTMKRLADLTVYMPVIDICLSRAKSLPNPTVPEEEGTS